jgi:Helix-hairpin-helix motif
MQSGQLSAPHTTVSPISGAVRRALALGLLIVLAVAGARMLAILGWNDPVAPATIGAGRPEPTGGEVPAEARPLSAPAPRVVYAGPRVSAFDANPPLAPELPSRQSAQPSFPLLAGSNEGPAPTVDSEPEAPPAEPALLRPSAPPAPPEETGAVSADRGIAPDAAGRRDLVDLNRATLDQLNDLRGVGRIGRAIIRGRPYASSDDLVQKRVLRRATYERVKDQITVR